MYIGLHTRLLFAVSRAPAVCILIAAGARAELQGHADYRTLIGVARGQGQVTLSPGRASRFASLNSADLALACTSSPLPPCYRIKIEIGSVDVEHSGLRLGLFDSSACRGGDNTSVNASTRYSVSYHETKGLRRIYVQYYDRNGDYHCWDGTQWCRNSWRPTGLRWDPRSSYILCFTKCRDTMACHLSVDGESRIEPDPIPVAAMRNCGKPEYFACGDMVTDYVRGVLAVDRFTIEELLMDEHLGADMEHVVIRQAPEGRYAMYGGLVRMSDAEIRCFYKVGSRDPETGSPWTVRDETIVWTRSMDNGHTWEEHERVIHEDRSTRQEICCGNGYLNASGLLMHPFYILNPDYEERAKANNWSRLHLALSRDAGGSWQTPQLDVPIAMPASFGGFTTLADGTVLLSVYGCKERGTFRHEAGVLRSLDDGLTWSDYAAIGQGADADGGVARLNETDVIELPDGDLLSMSRTQYEQFPLFRGMSHDSGRTWSVERSGLTGLCPSLLYTVDGPAEGTVVLAYHDRYGKHEGKGGMYLGFSHDGGVTWDEPVWISPGAYPCLLALGSGRILCSYYRDSTLLRGTIFRVPFPTGIRATAGCDHADTCAVQLTWDAYKGQQAADCLYHVYRSREPEVDTDDAQPVASVRSANTYADTDVQPGIAYYYRVSAQAGTETVGTSWVAWTRAGTAE